jgi:pyrroloquinoline quinone biosynthesis protein D
VTLSGSSRPKLARRARLRWDRLAGKAMLLYPERGLALNGSAAAILSLCDGERTVDEIVAHLNEQHGGASSAPIDEQTRRFLGALLSKGLISMEGAP